MSSAAGALAREICGETLLLHPERALSWPARRMLIVADTHFGKGSVFSHHGIPVPAGPDALDRERIDVLLESTGSRRLLIVGDFLHGPLAPHSAAARELRAWLQSLAPVEVLLVTGNHDRTAATGWRAEVAWEGSTLEEGPFCFVHDPDARTPRGAGYRIAGHVHPVVALGGLRKRRLRVPVFWERPDALVLPSFGLFTGGYRIRVSDGGRVFAADAGTVMEMWKPRRTAQPATG